MNPSTHVVPEKSYEDYLPNKPIRDFFKENYYRQRYERMIVEKNYPHLISRVITSLKIELPDNYTLEIPSVFEELKSEIIKSKYILDLQKDWDDEGSLPYEKKVYINAIKFVINYAVSIWNEIGIIIDTPSILHGPEGTIDIFWEDKKYKLLVNIPKKSNDPATFYGFDAKKQNEIKGKFNYKSEHLNVGLILWLKQIKNQ